jgi:tRNA 2-thiouridine synthesizing protein A
LRGRLAAARARVAGRASSVRRGQLAEEELVGLIPDYEIDALGTFCPEPVIRTQRQASSMEPGEVLLLLADDAGVEVDIPAWCISTRNEYLGVLKATDCYRVFVRRATRSGT